ncbi:SUMF1/EgtB/PvdO family nonheme iron enzyme [Nostoc spongiaeforme FACHB-130]|uniref:SUMF1/EgtB/PvdO family nonheme iron enzyme n=1 Tax=Nostoc spongiaeforme FACHB-130 TaxID=1357510 RepID=A0ABR8FX77_9NOSO|nr:SUMF1/EgtB/PvdO family nonheme iron enzyme [Nostoc spongiaeforme]MBD2594867.1 SUMF1/EgtB/PvdO family nonheme iron enzyme [Nostoc spongiaeforme FACHB-130]
MAKVALLIGISEYEPGLTPLPNAVNDVEAMRRVLVNPEMGDFAPENVTVLRNPQRQEMEDAIYNLYAHRDNDDLLLFYFSGHGVTVESGDFYFSTSITRKNQNKLIPTTALAGTNVHSWMNQSKSKRQVVILDCCFSGAFAKGLTAKDIDNIDLEQKLGGEGRAILTASSSTQYAFESDGLNLSIYTHYLVEGIEKGAADLDGDGLIAVDELHKYTKSKVQEASPAMTPEFYPVKEGYRIFLAKSPKDDPKLQYRKEVEKIALEDEGEIFVVNRFYLDELRNNLELSVDEVNAIEFEVLKPYRKRQEKLQRYELALSQLTQYPLTERDRNALKRLQKILSLRDEDVAPIEQRILSPKEAEYQRQQEEAKRAEYQRREAERLRQEEVERLRQEQQRVEYQKQEAERLRQEQQIGEYQREEAKRLRQEEERLRQAQENTQSTQGIQTRPFEFETATITGVNSGFLGIGKSCEISRRRGRAEFFAEDLGDGVVLEMVSIPGGTFLMGSPESETGRYDAESPQHNVTVQPFFIGKFPVTQGQWQAVAALDKVNIDLDPNPSRFKGANRPVESVSWDDAVEFCARLSKKTGKIYRLPSEAEWEYACRAGTTTPFYFGETITTDLANYDGTYTYGSAPKGEYRGQTTDVGKFPANPFGLFDMCGNVWEWCQDKWHKDYNNVPTDGRTWLTEGAGIVRYLRGGSWDDHPYDCRSASCGSKFWAGRDYIYDYIGFRVLCGIGRNS